jgi:hypothetical protein
VVFDGEPTLFESLGGEIEPGLEDLIDDGLKRRAETTVVFGKRFEFSVVLRRKSANRRKDDLLLEQEMGFDGAIESKSGGLRVAAGSARERAAQILEEGLEPPVLCLNLVCGALQATAKLDFVRFHWIP